MPKNGEAVSSYSPGSPERSGGYPGYQDNNKPNLEEVASVWKSHDGGNLFEVVGNTVMIPKVALADSGNLGLP